MADDDRPSWPGWSTLLVTMLAVFVGGALLVISFAAWLVASDESDHTDDWDGLGTWIGLLVGGFAVLVGVAATAVLAVVVRARRSARRTGDTAPLRRAAGVALVAGGLWLVLCFAALPIMSAPAAAWLPLAVPAVPLLIGAWGVLDATS